MGDGGDEGDGGDGGDEGDGLTWVTWMKGKVICEQGPTGRGFSGRDRSGTCKKVRLPGRVVIKF